MKFEEGELQQRINAIDEIVKNTALLSNITTQAELDRVLPELMASLGDFAQADRAYLFGLVPGSDHVLQMTHEWCAKNVQPTFAEMQNIAFDDIPNWYRHLSNGEAIHTPDWDAEKDNAPEEYALFCGQGIHSLIVIPMLARKKLKGYIGFDNPSKAKYAISLRILQTVAGHLSSLRESLRMVAQLEQNKKALESSIEELNQDTQILNALSIDYLVVSLCDFETATLIHLKQAPKSHLESINQVLGEDNHSFAERVKYYYDHFVIKETAPDFLQKVEITYLRNYLAEHERFAYSFQTIPNPAGHQFFEVQAVSLPGGSKFVLGFRYMDDIEAERQKHREVETSYRQQLTENRLTLAGLSTDYTIAFLVNVDTDAYEIVFYQTTNHAKAMDGVETFSEYVDRYVNNVVLPEFKESMKKTLSIADMRRRFEAETDYYFAFETLPNAAGLSCFQGHIVKEYTKNGHYALLGFRSVDTIVKQERHYKEALQKANDALQNQLDVITRALPGGMKISYDDPDYTFKYVSEQFAAMLGYDTPEELMDACGGKITSLAHPDDLATGIADALDQYTRSDHYATTYRMRCKDGSYKYVEDRGQKVVQSDGTVEHWNLILDKNDLMEKTIALETEKRSNEAKTEFLSRMSHDMRTPLNGIMGLLDICSEHPDDRTLVDSSREKAKVAANHLLSLVNDTLELNKLGDSQYTLHEETFDAQELFTEIHELGFLTAETSHIELGMNIDGQILKYPYLIGCPLQIKRIYLNLLTNAIKYNKKGGSVHCTLKEIRLDNDTVRHDIVIQDTGIGISADFLKRIYEPFSQADHGARSTYMGTGLGMPIVKKLLDRMGGTISISSELDVGTTVTLSMPFKIAKDFAPQVNSAFKTKSIYKKRNILLAEDNELNREIVEYMLRDAGMDVTAVQDGHLAVSAFISQPEGTFDAILLDIMMPVMDGIEASKAIRNSSKNDAKTIPIFAMTANAFEEDRQKTLAAGMNEHFTKPLNSKELIAAIQRYCG